MKNNNDYSQEIEFCEKEFPRMVKYVLALTGKEREKFIAQQEKDNMIGPFIVLIMEHYRKHNTAEYARLRETAFVSECLVYMQK